MLDALPGLIPPLVLPLVVAAAAVLYGLAALEAHLALRDRRRARRAAWVAQAAWGVHTAALVGGAVVKGGWTVWSAVPGAILLTTWLAASSYQVSDALLRETRRFRVPRPNAASPGDGTAPAEASGSEGFGLFLFPAIAAGLVLADLLVWWVASGPLTGPDRTVLAEPWVPVHAVMAATGWGLFTLAWVVNVMYGTQDRNLRRVRLGPLARLLPSLEALDRTSVRLVVAGLLFLSAGLVPGIVRAVALWGRFWFADPKVITTFLAVLAYAFYLVARTSLGWTAKRAGWVLTVGFILTVANLLVATPFLSRFHQWL